MGSRYALIAARGSSLIAPEGLAHAVGVVIERTGRTQLLEWPAKYAGDEGYAATPYGWTVLALPYQAVIAASYKFLPPPEAIEFVALGVEDTAAEFWYQTLGARYLEIEGVTRISEGTLPAIPKSCEQTDSDQARDAVVPSELTGKRLSTIPFEALVVKIIRASAARGG